MESETVLISVICTVKNGAFTLEKTIESVMKQTYQKWELLLIDDFSADNTWKIFERYARKDRRIRIFKATRAGRSNTLNQGIDLANGDYIAILDADDLFHPRKLEIQTRTLAENTDAFLIASERIIIFNNETPAWPKINKKISLRRISTRLCLRNIITHSSVLINKKKVLSLGGYNTMRTTQVDYELWLRAITDCLLIIKMDTHLVAKRLHPHQSFENKKRIRYIWNSTKLKWQYIFKNRRFLWLPIPLLTFCYALLPFSIRRIFYKKSTYPNP